MYSFCSYLLLDRALVAILLVQYAAPKSYVYFI